MKTFKLIDIVISSTLILSSVCLGFLGENWHYIMGFFLVGLWQITSMLVHAACGWFMQKGGSRSNYHWMTFTLFICVPVVSYFSVFVPLFFYLFYVMLAVAAIMSLYYTHLCYHELKILAERPLSRLK